MQSQYHTLPTINGVMQKEGREYQSKDVTFTANKSTVNFSIDLAGAYPEEAGINQWKRKIRFLRGKSIEVNEEYNLEKEEGLTFLSFMTPCKANISQQGRIELIEKSGNIPFRIVIGYDSKKLAAETEKIIIDDRHLKPVWGEEVIRIRLILKSPGKAGKIRYSIKPS
jgi:hypothetical protein